MAKKKATQCSVVLDWLKNRGELTNRQAVMELNILALPRRVMELRDAGYNIDMTYRVSKNGSRYGVYTLQE